MFLVPAYAVVVAAPSGPEQGCPSPHQITDALMARIPAVVVSASEASNPGVLKLSVTGGAGSDPLRIEMTDQGGEARLYRNLAVAEHNRGDCAALAETVALIVDRFLHDLGYEAPTTLPPPIPGPDANLSRGPPPAASGGGRFDLFAGGSWRGASTDESDFELGFGLGFERGIVGRRFAATLTVGTSATRSATATDGSIATLQRMPFRLGFWVPINAGPGQLEPGVRAGFDLLFLKMDAPYTGDTTYLSARAELALGYRVNMLRRFFARVGGAVGAGRGYDVKNRNGGQSQLFTEPSTYIKSGLELGFSFQ